jgi:hypothetical protein
LRSNIGILRLGRTRFTVWAVINDAFIALSSDFGQLGRLNLARCTKRSVVASNSNAHFILVLKQ